jgi:hypothetical protein
VCATFGQAKVEVFAFAFAFAFHLSPPLEKACRGVASA